MAAERSAGGKQVPKQDGRSHPGSKGEKCVCLHVFVCAHMYVLYMCVHVCMYVCVCVRVN